MEKLNWINVAGYRAVDYVYWCFVCEGRTLAGCTPTQRSRGWQSRWVQTEVWLGRTTSVVLLTQAPSCSPLGNASSLSSSLSCLFAQRQLTTTTTTTVLWPFVRDYPGESVPEGYTILDFAEAEMMGWQWHQLNHMQAIVLRSRR